MLLVPLLMTFILQITFGSLFDPKPRLGIVDAGSSTVTRALEDTEGIELTLLDEAEELKTKVEANDLDAGLVLQEGFDDAVRAGARPPLEFYVGGETLASNRIILAATTIDLIRNVRGGEPPVDIVMSAPPDEGFSIAVRLIPLLVMYALVIAAVFLPSFSLADEREKGTLDSLIVTPVKLPEVVAAKGILGFILALAMAVITLLLNNALGTQPLPLLVVLILAVVVCVEIGLIYGTAAKDATAVFALIKGTGILLFGPTIFYIFPNWPQWIAKIFPTYWIINPIFEVTLNRAGFKDIWLELVAALGVIALLALPVWLLTRRLQTKLAVG
jgi:ABC-2 type transport system permease protein